MPKALPVSALFSERLRMHRTLRKYTVDQTANGVTRCGHKVSRHIITAVEAKNVQGISIDMVAATAKFFGMTIGQFMTGPLCPQCQDAPPPGFTCNGCRTSTPAEGEER